MEIPGATSITESPPSMGLTPPSKPLKVPDLQLERPGAVDRAVGPSLAESNFSVPTPAPRTSDNPVVQKHFDTRADIEATAPYLTDLSDEEWEKIRPTIVNSEDPVEATYEWAEALEYSRYFKKPLEETVAALPVLREAWLGRDFGSYRDGWTAFKDSIALGQLGQQVNDLGLQWKRNGGDMNDPLVAQIQRLRDQQSLLFDRAPRHDIIETLKIVGPSIAFSAEIGLKSAAFGAAVAAGAAAAIAAAPATAVFAAGGAAALGGSAAALGGIAGNLRAWQLSIGGMEGSQYVDMRLAGANHLRSAQASTVTALITGTLESAFGFVPAAIGKLGGKAVSHALADTIAKRLVAGGALQRFAAQTMDWVLSGLEEGVLEELPQQVTENAGQIWAVRQSNKDYREARGKAMSKWESYRAEHPELTAKIEEAALPMRKVFMDAVNEELAKQGLSTGSEPGLWEGAWESTWKGVVCGLIMGGPVSIGAYIKDVRDLGDLRSAAKTAPSRAAFVQEGMKLAPEGVNPEVWAKGLSNAYDTARAAEDAAVAYAAEKEAVKPAEGQGYRTAEGRAYVQETVLESTADTRVVELTTGDPEKGVEYAGVTVSEDLKTSTAEITSLYQRKGQPDGRIDVIVETARRYVGWEVNWTPKGSAGKAVLARAVEIINPGHPELGLTIVAEKIGGQPASKVVAWRAQLAKVYPTSGPVLDLITAFTTNRAERLVAAGKFKSVDAYFDTMFQAKAFTRSLADIAALSPAKAEQVLREGDGIFGAHIREAGKSVIYAAKGSDHWNVVHEMAHFYSAEAAATGLDKTDIEALVAKELGDAKPKAIEDWTELEDETWARIVQNYAAGGQTTNPEYASLMARVAKFLRDTVARLKRLFKPVDAEAIYKLDRIFGRGPVGEISRAAVVEMAGVQLERADADTLVEAKRLEGEGLGADEIYARTGWRRSKWGGAWTRDESVATMEDLDEKVKTRAGLTGIIPYLTQKEAQELTEGNAKKLIALWENLPSSEEYAASAIAGHAKKGWYERSARAIVEVWGPVDAPRFALLLAALSPRVSVEGNLLNALNVWKGWVEAGRPLDPATIGKIMGDNVQGGRGEKSVLDAWRNNAIRALTSTDPVSEVLSGPKAASFADNLRGLVNEVTNDAWMAIFANVDQKEFASYDDPRYNKKGDPSMGRKSGGYLAASARVRMAAEAASRLTGEPWTPAEIQETVWSFGKAVYEKREGLTQSMREVYRKGLVGDAEINSVADFEILLTEGVYGQILEAAGYGQELDAVRAFRSDPQYAVRYGAGRTVEPRQDVAPVRFDVDAALDRALGRLENTYRDRRAAEAIGYVREHLSNFNIQAGLRPGLFGGAGPWAIDALPPLEQILPARAAAAKALASADYFARVSAALKSANLPDLREVKGKEGKKPKLMVTDGYLGTYEGVVEPGLVVGLEGASPRFHRMLATSLGLVTQQEAMILWRKPSKTETSAIPCVFVGMWRPLGATELNSFLDAIAGLGIQGATIIPGGRGAAVLHFGSAEELEALTKAIPAAMKDLPFQGLEVHDVVSDYLTASADDGSFGYRGDLRKDWGSAQPGLDDVLVDVSLDTVGRAYARELLRVGYSASPERFGSVFGVSDKEVDRFREILETEAKAVGRDPKGVLFERMELDARLEEAHADYETAAVNPLAYLGPVFTVATGRPTGETTLTGPEDIYTIRAARVLIFRDINEFSIKTGLLEGPVDPAAMEAFRSSKAMVYDALRVGTQIIPLHPLAYHAKYQGQTMGQIDDVVSEQERAIPRVRDSLGNLVAPNGNPSRLNGRLWGVVRTPAFKAWFGDWENDPYNASKVVDENGEPLYIGHLSRVPDAMDFFDTTVSDGGTHFGGVNDFLHYVEIGGAKQGFSGFLNIRHPFRAVDRGNFGADSLVTDVTKGLGWAEGHKLHTALIEARGGLPYGGRIDNGVVQRFLKERGFDGVVYMNRFEVPRIPNLGAVYGELDDAPAVYDDESMSDILRKAGGKPQDCYIAFDSAQFKSSVARRYDGTQQRIHFERISEAEERLVAELEEVVPSSPVVQPAEDGEGAYRRVIEAVPEYDGLFDDWAKRFAGEKSGRIKAKTSFDRKVGEGTAPNAVLDIDARTLAFADHQSLAAAYREIVASGRVVRSKNRFAKPLATGYRDILMNLRMTNGAIVELQLANARVLAAKNSFGHVFYDVVRNLEAAFNDGKISAADYYDSTMRVKAELDYAAKIGYTAAYTAWDADATSALASAIESSRPLVRRSARLTEGASWSALPETTRKDFASLLENAYSLSSTSKNTKSGSVNVWVMPTSEPIIELRGHEVQLERDDTYPGIGVVLEAVPDRMSPMASFGRSIEIYRMPRPGEKPTAHLAGTAYARMKRSHLEGLLEEDYNVMLAEAGKAIIESVALGQADGVRVDYFDDGPRFLAIDGRGVTKSAIPQPEPSTHISQIADANLAEALAFVGEKGPQNLWTALRNFRRGDPLTVIGKHGGDPMALYQTMKVLRDPRFETARLVAVNDDGLIQDIVSLSASNPNAVSFSPAGEAPEKFLRNTVGAWKQKGWKFWMVHNHPSGDPTPSSTDRSSTVAMEREFGLTLKGHLIMDHGKFQVRVNAPGNPRSAGWVEERDESAGPDPFLAPTTSGLPAMVTSFNDAARLVERAVRSEDGINVFTMAAYGALRGHHYIPYDMITRTPNWTMDFLPELMRLEGSVNAVAIVTDKTPEYIMDAVRSAHGARRLVDVIIATDGGEVERMRTKEPYATVLDTDLRNPYRGPADYISPAGISSLSVITLRTQYERKDIEDLLADARLFDTPEAFADFMEQARASGKMVPGSDWTAEEKARHYGMIWEEAHRMASLEPPEGLDVEAPFVADDDFVAWAKDNLEAYLKLLVKERGLDKAKHLSRLEDAALRVARGDELTERLRADVTRDIGRDARRLRIEAAGFLGDADMARQVAAEQEGLAPGTRPLRIQGVEVAPTLANLRAAVERGVIDPELQARIIEGQRTLATVEADLDRAAKELRELKAAKEAAEAEVADYEAAFTGPERALADKILEESQVRRDLHALRRAASKGGAAARKEAIARHEARLVGLRAEIAALQKGFPKASPLARTVKKAVKAQARDLDAVAAAEKTVLTSRYQQSVNRRDEAIREMKRKHAEREAYRAERALKQAYAKKIMRRSGPSIHIDYDEAIARIQKLVDPRFRAKSTIESRKRSLAFFNSHPDVLADVGPEIIDRFIARSLDDWTVAELRDLAAQVERLRKLGRVKRSLYLAQRARRIEAARREIKVLLTGSEEVRATAGDVNRKGALGEFLLDTFTPAEVVDRLGGGVLKTLLIDRVNDAWNAQARVSLLRREAIYKKAKALGISPGVLHKPGNLGIQEHVDIGGWKGYEGWTPTWEDIAYWSIGVGNERTLKALTQGNGIPEEVIRAGIAMMPQELRELADAIAADLDERFPALRAAYRSRYNKDVTAEASYLPMRRLEASYESRGEEVAADLAARSGQVRGVVPKGFLKARAEIADLNQSPIRTDIMGVWASAVDREEAFISIDELVSELNAVFGDMQVQRALIQKGGVQAAAWVKKYIADVANPSAVRRANGVPRLVRNAPGNIARSALAFNVMSYMKQAATSLLPFLGDAGPAHLVGAILEMSGNPVRFFDEVDARSPMVRERRDESVWDLLASDQKSDVAKAIREIGDVGMAPFRWIDYIEVAIGWKAVFNKNKALGEAAAARAADEAVARTQPSVRIQDMPQIYRSSSDLTRTALMFTSALNKFWNMTASMPRAIRERKWKRVIGDAVAIAATGWVMAAVAGVRGDDDEKRKRRLLGAAQQYIDMIPFVGSEISNLVMPDAGPSRGGINLFPTFEDWSAAARDVKKDDWDKAFLEALVGAARAAGLPAVEMKRILKAAESGDWRDAVGIKHD